MKITLIQPPKPHYAVDADEHWQLTRPFSLFFLAASIEKHTPFDVRILDLEQKKYRDIPLENVFHNDDSRIFGITATTYTRFEAIKIAKYLKETFTDSVVIVGGAHFMYCAEDTLSRIYAIDIVVRGEGEVPLVELTNAINQNESYQDIRGISYRKDGKIVHNPDHDYFENLDSLPFYSDFSWDEYPEYVFGVREDIRATSVMSSRGCPYQCIFCSKAGMKYRLRNPTSVVDELEILKNKHDLDGVNFLDLTFTAIPHHVRSVCQEMIDRQLDLKWWCESRANIPLDLLDLMKAAGCVSTVIGVESGSPRILSNIAKNITIEQVENFCRKCVDLGINVTPYFMYSHPGETVEDVKQTLDLISRLEEFTGKCSFQPTMIFPGTEIEKIAHDKGILSEDFSWCEPYQSDLNVKLGQLPNTPLFIDRLSPDYMVGIHTERTVTSVVNEALKMSMKDLVLRGIDSIIKGKASSRLIFSPKFYKNLIEKKFLRQK